MPRRDAVVVGCRHIEIGSREITFVLVVGFKDRSGITGESACAQTPQRFYVPIGRQVFAVGAFSKWVIASLPVHLAVGRIEVVGVGIHRVSVVEPAFGHRMLFVNTVADNFVVAAFGEILRPLFG